MTNKFFENVLYFLVVFVAFLVLSLTTGIFENSDDGQVPLNINDDQISNLNISVDKTELEKYLDLKTAGNTIAIFDSRLVSPQFTPHDLDRNNEIALRFLGNNSKRIRREGTISGGYLYIRAGAGSSESLGPVADNESVYLYLGTKGGHLFGPESLVSEPTGNGLTQLLFALDEVPFTQLPYSVENDFTVADLLNRFNSSSELLIGTFVSSTRFGAIEEVTIAYRGDGLLHVIE